MKRYLLVLLAVVLVSFMLASCVPQDHPPAVTFVTPSNVNAKAIVDGGLYGPGVYTFEWKAGDIDKKDTVNVVFTLTHAGTTIKASVENNTATATLTEAGTYTAKVVATDSKGLTAVAKKDFAIQTNANIEFTSKDLFGFEYINLSWQSKDDSEHVYQYNLDGGSWITVSSTPSTSVSLKFVPKSAGGTVADGEHYLFVRIADPDVDLSTAPEAVFSFMVDTTPPVVIFQNSDREVKNYDNVYIKAGDSNPEGRYDLVQFGILPDGLSPIKEIKIRFYEFVSAEASDGSAVTGRIRLGLGSSQGNNVFDEWVTSDASGNLYNGSTQPWFEWDPYYVNKYGTDYILFNDNDVKLWGADGKLYIAHDLFKLNTQYAMYVDMVDEAGNESGGYVTFSIKERYNSDNEPVVYMSTDNATAVKGSTITFKVNAPNLKEYCKGSAGINADNTTQATLSYVQIPVILTSSATLTTDSITIDKTNFMPGKTDLTAYKIFPLTSHAVLVEVYKGFVSGTDETDPATDVLANISIATPSDAASDTQYRATVGYEGLFAYYPIYGDLPNPLFRDNNNRPIDGIVIPNETAISIVNPSESK